MDDSQSNVAYLWIVVTVLGLFTYWQHQDIKELKLKLDNYESQYSSIESTSKDTSYRVDDLEANSEDMDSRVSGLESDYDDLESRVSNVEY